MGSTRVNVTARDVSKGLCWCTWPQPVHLAPRQCLCLLGCVQPNTAQHCWRSVSRWETSSWTRAGDWCHAAYRKEESAGQAGCTATWATLAVNPAEAGASKISLVRQYRQPSDSPEHGDQWCRHHGQFWRSRLLTVSEGVVDVPSWCWQSPRDRPVICGWWPRVGKVKRAVEEPRASKTV
jgi:hypothetical protein